MARWSGSGRGDLPGLGWVLGIGTVVGAAVGWVVSDLNSPDSQIRHWIEIGKRKKERADLEREMKDSDIAVEIEESIIEENRNREQNPPSDDMPL